MKLFSKTNNKSRIKHKLNPGSKPKMETDVVRGFNTLLWVMDISFDLDSNAKRLKL
jgi:hypothetical protein